MLFFPLPAYLVLALAYSSMSNFVSSFDQMTSASVTYNITWKIIIVNCQAQISYTSHSITSIFTNTH